MAEVTTGKKVVVIIAFIAYVITMVFNALCHLETYADIGVFQRGMIQVYTNYTIDFMPIENTFTIWGAIYVLQGCFVFYSLSCIFCCGVPNHIPGFVYIFYTINMAANVGWLYAFVGENMKAAMTMLVILEVTSYVCLGGIMYGIKKNTPRLLEEGNVKHLILSIPFSLNALGIYAACVTISTLVQLGILLHHVNGWLSNSEASVVCMGLLVIEFTVYVWLDQAMFEVHFQRVLSPYIVTSVCQVAIWFRSQQTGNTEMGIFSLTMLTCVLFILTLKCVRMCIGCAVAKKSGSKDLQPAV